ncbi:MAG TPA: SusC/RagA family TonB-linked outer membrane protein [Puia sp.]
MSNLRVIDCPRLRMAALFSLIHVCGYSQAPDTLLHFSKNEVTIGAVIREMNSIGFKLSWPPGYPDTTLSVRVANTSTMYKAVTSIGSKCNLVPLRLPTGYSLVPDDQYTYNVVVTGFDNERLADASIYNTSTKRTEKTDPDGSKTLTLEQPGQSIIVTHIGMEPQTVLLDNEGTVLVHLNQSIPSLAATIVNAPYVHAKPAILIPENRTEVNIPRQDRIPSNNNPLDILTGRDPGCLTLRSNGSSTSVVNIRIHGKQSAYNSCEPLYIVNNMIFAPANLSISNLPPGISGGTLSPFSYIDPADIESIAVLKDAEATAIYGARGANGVILITTRHAKQSRKTRWDVHLGTGVGYPTGKLRLMNSNDYYKLMTEAYKNDNIPIDPNYPPSFKTWGTSAYNNWQKFIMGDAVPFYNFQASATGGTQRLSYYGGVSGLQESSPYPSYPMHRRLNTDFGLHHHSKDDRLDLKLQGLFGWDRNEQFMWLDPATLQLLAPNVPIGPGHLRDSQGRVITQIGNDYFLNPYYFLNQRTRADGHNYLVSGSATWKINPFITAYINTGVNEVLSGESGATPVDSTFSPIRTDYSARTVYRSKLFEPQLNFNKVFGRWSFDLLTGANIQSQRTYIRSSIDSGTAGGRHSDSLSMNVTSKALVGRLSVLLDSTYIFNFSYREDGSDRLNPAIYYGGFYSMGLGWIFSRNTFIRNLLPSLSLGRLRASYGVTGNDQVNNTYRPSLTVPGFTPTSYTQLGVNLDSQKAPWERIKKLEAALEVGLLKNTIQFSAVWYRNESTNQLIPTSAPAYGAPVTFKSWPAVVLNQGWDLQFKFQNLSRGNWNWTTVLNWSFPSTRLVRFPGLAQTILADDLVVGQSLDVVRGYRYLGVNPQTGLFQFADLNHDGKISTDDMTVIGKQGVTSFGGLNNIVQYKNFTFECLIDARIANGTNYLTALYQFNAPGTAISQYNNTVVDFNNRWRSPGDQARYQRASTGLLYNSAADSAAAYYLQSSAQLANTSFARVKRLSLSYQLPTPRRKDGKRHPVYNIHLTGMNLLTMSPYKGPSPELQSATVQPIMRSVEMGLNIKF